MSNDFIDTPLIDFKGDNLNLIKINLDPSENSTGSSIFSVDGLNPAKNLDDDKKSKTKILIKKPKEQNLLKKKIKRSKKNKNNSVSNDKKSRENKIKTAKYKLIYNIYNEFKSCSPLYKEFIQFNLIEKKVKNNSFNSACELVSDIRNAFSQIFYSHASKFDLDNYNKTFILCELFEKIYKNFDSKILTKESKTLSDTINKLKRELRHTSILKNNIEKNIIQQQSKTKFKFQFADFDHNIPEMSVKKFKIELTEKIQKLTNEQKKGILSIISTNYVDKNNNTAFELDVNKIPFNQLKQLEKYLNNCIKKNNNSISSIEKETPKDEDQRENDIFKEDDLSSDLSDDEDEDEY